MGENIKLANGLRDACFLLVVLCSQNQTAQDNTCVCVCVCVCVLVSVLMLSCDTSPPPLSSSSSSSSLTAYTAMSAPDAGVTLRDPGAEASSSSVICLCSADVQQSKLFSKARV